MAGWSLVWKRQSTKFSLHWPKRPCPPATDYVAEDENLQELPAAVEVSEHLFGGMPCQLGWCNGHDTRLNCLEYHRDSEFNLGTEDFILLLAHPDSTEAAQGAYIGLTGENIDISK